MNNRKIRNNIVYSTNPDFIYETNVVPEIETLLPEQQNLKVFIDKKHRKGKIVTIISGFTGKKTDLEKLSKLLKTKCCVGGTIKDNDIIIQGNMSELVLKILKEVNYKAKKSGN